MAHYTVILDACVMYPAPLRSLLLYLAQTGLFRARFTNKIHDEWINNLLKNRPDLSFEKLTRTRTLVNAHMPDCLIEGFEPLVESLNLPDPKDRHVLAAAVKGQAEGIITFNLKDFPNDVLSPLGVVAIHPNVFLCDMLEFDTAAVLLAAQNHRRSLKNPPMDAHCYLDVLQKQNLRNFTSRLKKLTLLL